MNPYQTTAVPGTSAYDTAPTFIIGTADEALRQHCLELAINRLGDKDAARQTYDQTSVQVAKEFYDFIKGAWKDPAPKHPTPADGCSTARPNSFEASVEPGKPASGGSILYSRIGGWTIEVVPCADAPSGIDAVAKDGSNIPVGKYRVYTETRFERISQ